MNGNPLKKGLLSRYEHQFSYERYDLVEIYLISFLIYAVLMPFISYRLLKNYHNYYMLLFVYSLNELMSRFLLLVYNFSFSLNGIEHKSVEILGYMFEMIACTLIILILMLIAKGYKMCLGSRIPNLSRNNINRRFIYIWLVLAVVLVFSHVAALNRIDNLLINDIYDTVYGKTEICIRILFAGWFIAELKKTFFFINSFEQSRTMNRSEQSNNHIGFNSKKYAQELEELNDYYMIEMSQNESQDSSRNPIDLGVSASFIPSFSVKHKIKMFYLHFGAWSLVWFIYLPVLVIILTFVSELFRFRLFISENFED